MGVLASGARSGLNLEFPETFGGKTTTAFRSPEDVGFE